MSATEVQRYTPTPAPAIANGSRSLPLNDVWNLAADLASTKFLGKDTSPAQVFALMLLCEAEQIPYVHAILRYDIIEGKPSIKASAMLAEFQARGGMVEWIQFDDVAAVGKFSHPVIHPKPVTVTVDYESCLKRGLPQGRDGIKTNWKNHRAAMLRARCVTTAVRMIYPGIAVGIYSPEEIEDMRAGESALANLPMPGRDIDVTPKSLPQSTAPADAPVIGWRGSGYDTRSYSEVVKSAVSEANDGFARAARAAGVEGVKAPFIPGQVHGAVIKAAVESEWIPKPDGPLKSGEALSLITEKLYPTCRPAIRSLVNEHVTAQLAAAVKALEADPAPAQDQAETQTQEAIPAGREPGDEG